VIVYLVRHGLAEDVGPAGDDRSRRLTERGRERMKAAAAGLRTVGIAPELVLSSPYPRAMETAEIVVAAIGGSKPQSLDALTPDVPAAETVKAVGRFGRYEQVMLVGHQPNLGEVASLLLTGLPQGAAIEVKKGTCIALEVVGSGLRGEAVLRWLLPPSVLRGLGGD
jgi:phosphohistidine phosphatase